MNQIIIKQDCWSACPKFDYKTNPGKTECEREISAKFIHAVIHGVYMYMAARGIRRYQFYALQQQQKIISNDRKKLPCWKANKLKQLFNICTSFNSFGSFMKLILILKLFLNPDDHQCFHL